MVGEVVMEECRSSICVLQGFIWFHECGTRNLADLITISSYMLETEQVWNIRPIQIRLLAP